MFIIRLHINEWGGDVSSYTHSCYITDEFTEAWDSTRHPDNRLKPVEFLTLEDADAAAEPLRRRWTNNLRKIDVHKM